MSFYYGCRVQYDDPPYSGAYGVFPTPIVLRQPVVVQRPIVVHRYYERPASPPVQIIIKQPVQESSSLVPVIRQIPYEATEKVVVREVVKQSPYYDNGIVEKKIEAIQPVPNYDYRLKVNSNFPGYISEIAKISEKSFRLVYKIDKDIRSHYTTSIGQTYMRENVYDREGNVCGTIDAILYI